VVLLSGGPFEEHLRARGVAVSTCALPTALSKLDKKLSPAASLRAVPAALAYLGRLRGELRGAALLYFNTPKALLLGSAATAFLRSPRIFHLHDLLVREHFSATNIRLLVGAANRCRRVIANSEATAAAFRNAGGRAPVTVIPNGFDAEIFDRVPPAEAARLRGEIAPGAEWIAGVFGRLAPWKGQHVLLEAAAQCPGLHVVVVGDALFTAEDRRYADELRRLAAEPPLRGRVTFLGFRSDVAELMCAMDAIVHCSTAPEPFGRVLVEAMLARKPVIATTGGGPSEIVVDGGSGLLVQPGSVEALVKALQTLASSAGLRDRLANEGRNRALKHYALPNILRQTEKVLRECLE
jgi:glycosyltransferase involved in cell wall biosynthesis